MKAIARAILFAAVIFSVAREGSRFALEWRRLDQADAELALERRKLEARERDITLQFIAPKWEGEAPAEPPADDTRPQHRL
jgi:hypothetical protein